MRPSAGEVLAAWEWSLSRVLTTASIERSAGDSRMTLSADAIGPHWYTQIDTGKKR